MSLAVERVFFGTVGVADGGGVLDQGISTDICEDMNKLARGRAALSIGPAGLEPENKLDGDAYC